MQASLAQARGREEEIADRVAGLHRGDDPQLGEARDVGVGDDLRMLVAPARGLGVGPEACLEPVQHQAVAAIADGVHGDLGPRGLRPLHQGQALVALGQLQAQRIGVAVGLQQGRAARSQGAVHIELDALHADQAGGVRLRALGQHLLGAAGIHVVVDADMEGALGGLVAQQGQIVGHDAHIGHAGPAARGVELTGLAQGLALEGLVRRRDDVPHQALGVVDQHAVGLAVGALQDVAAGRGDGRGGNARLGQGGAGGDAGVAVRAAQHDHPARRGGVQVGLGREALLGPVRLDPAPAEDGPLGMGGGIRLHGGDQLGQRLGLVQIQGQLAQADAGQVGVGVDEARIGGGALQVDVAHILGGLGPGGR